MRSGGLGHSPAITVQTAMLSKLSFCVATEASALSPIDPLKGPG